MSEHFNPDRPSSRPDGEMNEQESRSMLIIIMSGIAALFIFSIVMAFNYTSNRMDDRLAARKPTPSSISTPPKAAPATTGSGGGNSQ